VILGTLSVLGIILLFIRPRPTALNKLRKPESPEKLFTQIIENAGPQVLRLWENGDRFFPKKGVRCDSEIVHDNSVGKTYYKCNPHFWQCFWQGGAKDHPSLEIDSFGQTFHLVAKPVADPVQEISEFPRYVKPLRGPAIGHGYLVELAVREIPGLSQTLILADTCRDTFLPERIYGYGKPKDKTDDGFVWDNFDRKLFIDKFYVTNRQVNEWKLLRGKTTELNLDRKSWPKPALLSKKDQKAYCAFFGKRLLEAKLFDAASMYPIDPKNPLPEKVLRPDTPWQRDISRSFLGVARINPDYQLTPLDCQLAQVQGCLERYFTLDSATWMGMHYSLGFYPESLENFIEPKSNLKLSSRFLPPSSPWHELGKLSSWKGEQDQDLPVAFRCYEEVAQ
jgi:hypothetical protein